MRITKTNETALIMRGQDILLEQGSPEDVQKLTRMLKLSQESMENQ